LWTNKLFKKFTESQNFQGNSRINEAPKIDFSQFLEGILEQKIDIKNSTIQEFLTRFSDQENPQADLQEKINSYSDLFEDLKCNLKLAHLLIDKTIENPLKSELHDDPLSIKEDFEDFLVSLEDLFSKSNQLKVEHEKLQETHQEIVEEKLEIQRKSNEDSTTFALKVSSLESEIVAKDEVRILRNCLSENSTVFIVGNFKIGK
jgi:hypothetical protein